jgi:ribosomal protein S27AE
VPHKHKTVQFAVLKFYKVDDNGKITRLRKDCPECGACALCAAVCHCARHLAAAR